MLRTRLGRLFWIGAAALLCGAALVALVGLVRGAFSETDSSILLTLGAVFLAGSTAIAAYALVERQTLARLGLAVIGTAPVWGAVLVMAVWADTAERWAATALVALVAELVLVTNLLLLRDRRFAPLAMATAVALTVTVSLLIVVIWAQPGGSVIAKTLGAFAILTGLGYLLMPILQRFAAAPTVGTPAAETLIATLDGIELIAADRDARAGADAVVSDDRGRIHVTAGVADTTLAAGHILVLRRTV